MLLLMLQGVVSGCSSLALHGVNALAPEFNGQASQDLPYGDLDRQRMDLYLPSASPGPGDNKDAPLLVFVYGGAWQQGNRSQYRWAGEALAGMGLAVAIPDYRLYPEVTFPGYVSDVADALPAALAACQARAACDGRSVILIGHSAGAHIAALLALDPGYLGNTDVSLMGWVGLAGPYDFLPLKGRLKRVFAHSGSDAETQPVEFASGDDPPSLLLHGENDRRVRPKNSASLAAALRAAGASVEYHEIPDASHSAILLGLSGTLQEDTGVYGLVERFVGCLRQQVVQEGAMNCQP